MKCFRMILLCLLAGMALAASAAGMAAEKTYVAGVEASFPPWAYVEGGEYKGIAIDAMRAIADDQGFKVEFKDLPFPSLIPALSAGKIDILVTGLTVTKERAQVIDFTIPWWETNNVVLVPEDSDLNVFTAVCCGATVGVQGGSSQQDWMERNVVDAGMDTDLATYDSYTLAIEDMLIGRIDSVTTDYTSAQKFIEQGRPIKIVGKVMIHAPMALAVTKGDPKQILAKINKGILAISDSGQWAKIVHNYIPGIDLPPVPAYMPKFVDTYNKPVAGLPKLGN